MKAKLLAGQRVLVDHQTDEWIHMRRVCDSSEQLSAWVYKKYIEEQPEPAKDEGYIKPEDIEQTPTAMNDME